MDWDVPEGQRHFEEVQNFLTTHGGVSFNRASENIFIMNFSREKARFILLLDVPSNSIKLARFLLG